jgi:hypothetical protein
MESQGAQSVHSSLTHDPLKSPPQAKLKNLHEVVVRNRLEQLRKRQRDEALQAQEELLAGVAKSASRKWDKERFVVEAELAEQEVVPEEEIEPYDRSMSPALIDITKMPLEERQIDILTEQEDWRELVGFCYAESFVESDYYMSTVQTTPSSGSISICPQGSSTTCRD